MPSYQRAYSWEKPQWQQLIDDLKDSEGNYYLGHFLFEIPEDGKDCDRLFVIDGQQRLTTLIIFFSCLRNALLRSDEDYAHKMCEYIHDVYLRDRGRQLAKAFMLVSQVEKDDTFEMADLKRIDRMAYCYPLLIKSRVICNCDGKTRPTEKGPDPMK